MALSGSQAVVCLKLIEFPTIYAYLMASNVWIEKITEIRGTVVKIICRTCLLSYLERGISFVIVK